jgi:hypothetical protein
LEHLPANIENPIIQKAGCYGMGKDPEETGTNDGPRYAPQMGCLSRLDEGRRAIRPRRSLVDSAPEMGERAACKPAQDIRSRRLPRKPRNPNHHSPAQIMNKETENKPLTVAEFEAELSKARKQADRMADAYVKESRVIALLVAAGIVTEEKVAAARELLKDIK